MLRFACLRMVLCFTVALFIGSPTCRAAEPLTILQDTPAQYTIGRSIYLLEDPAGNLTFEQVQQRQSTFVKSQQEAPVYGPSSSVVWGYFRVRNQSQEAKWYLEIGSSYLYAVDLYRQKAPGSFELLRAGAGQPFQSRLLKTNRLILPLHVAAGTERTFYIRFRSRSILRFPLQIATMPVLYEANHRADVVNGIYFGLLFALMMYNLFVYFSLRDKAYLYYVLFIFSVAAEIACIRGYLHEWWPEPLLWQVNTRVFLGLAILFSLLFTNAILQVQQNLPWLYRWRWIMVACLFLVLLLNLLGFYVWAFTTMLLTFIPIYLYVYSAGILIYRQGFKPALYYTLGLAAFGAGIIIYIAKDNNLLPDTIFTESSLQLGNFIEAVVLSYALTSKFNMYKQEKEQVQAQAMQQATTFSQELIQSQEHERKRIAAELHDSVGQSLILIKNRLLLLQKQIDKPDKVALYAHDLLQTVAHTIGEIRGISYGLRPFQLDLLGLTQSIHGLAEEVSEASGIAIRVQADLIDGILLQEQEINVYRIVQESLNNIVKHSGAHQANIVIGREEQQIRIIIEDNGKGMPVSSAIATPKQGFGMRGIQERLSILAGKLVIKPAEPHGTIFQITLPVAATPVLI
ncbi:sensor histidine kinase [Adhaeribacter pallidiroseus]|uniref:histidine kinase n=1 Tax=Adhaeribacter pallidiroseus TaxID=2072847 RepID=A0A369QKM1_9BACT|nr:7TM diverse intracellular signaling domain-containing protein [Adhaeribacter pallidiroseus]RDC63399.1 Sensor histidine kinase MctS [Adhaeribacter pallidiroseus]